MENFFKIGSQILMIIGFFVFFIGLLASPIIYVNVKQAIYFKRFSKKYFLKLAPRKNYIRRDFPKAYGETGDKNVYIEASVLGEFYYNFHFDTYKYRNPVVIIGVEFNQPELRKLRLIQKKIFTSHILSKFDEYFDVEVEPAELKSKIFSNVVKQSIINYSSKSQSYFNLFFNEDYLISISNYELTNEKKYKETIHKFNLMLSIANQR